MRGTGSTFIIKPYLLKNHIQNYAWGAKNDAAFIPKLIGIEIEKDVPYAELWMGAHPKAPSEINLNGNEVPLNTCIERFPDQTLGNHTVGKFDGRLPFLFKVLSAAEALSIQAHPNKTQAIELHASDPKNYPDANHKPEIAIALSSLQALVGFKPYAELIASLKNYVEIALFLGDGIMRQLEEGLKQPPESQSQLVKKMYAHFMERSETSAGALTNAIDNLRKRLSAQSKHDKPEQLFLDMRKIYPGADVGLFAIFMLNFVELQAGEAIFLKAGIPHAYLKGNIVECMANSDNVVRAGLTPKFQDKKALVDILTYALGPVPILGTPERQQEIQYPVPVPEFAISQYQLENEKKVFHNSTAAIILITSGKASILWRGGKMNRKTGNAIFIPAALPKFEIETDEKCTVFIARVPE